MSIRLTLLGCGASTGTPHVGCQCSTCRSGSSFNRRSRSSAFIESTDGRTILIDPTPDLRTQALRYDIRRIDSVLITHEHADHIFGIDDLRPFAYAATDRLALYAPRDQVPTLQRRFDYCFEEGATSSSRPRLALQSFDWDVPFSLGATSVRAIRYSHANIDVAGFCFDDIIYATDCHQVPDATLKQMAGARVLIVGALRMTQHPTHLSIPEALSLLSPLNIERVIFTHLSHETDYHSVSSQLPKGFELAYDGMVIE